MRKQTLATGAAIALVAGGLTTLVAAPAFAHTPAISASCETGVIINAENYDANAKNTWSITVNGNVTTGVFGSSTHQVVPFPQGGTTSAWAASIDAPGTQYDKSDSGSFTCGTTPTPTTPPVTETPTPEPTTPPVTETPTPEPTPTTPPVTETPTPEPTPPVTETPTPTPTPTASTPPVVVTPEPKPTPSTPSYVPTMPTPDKTPVAVVIPKDVPPTTGPKASTPTGELAFTGSEVSPWVYLWASLAVALGAALLLLPRLRRRFSQR